MMKNKKGFRKFVLAGDIGGTNINLGVFGKDLLFSMHFKTKEFSSLIPAIKAMIRCAEDKDIKLEDACFAVAGPVKGGFVKPTNIRWNVDSKEILKKTSLKRVKLINDFEAIGYGIKLLTSKDLFVVRKCAGKGTKVIIGAGTGLGKAIITDKKVIPSEGGHADFPAQDEFELKLVSFIKKKRRMDRVNYEEVVSGRGIEIIYSFLTGKKAKAEWISKNSKETMNLFTKFYARCAKGFVLDGLAKGGLYIAGGIAAKNKELFKSKGFLDEFENSDLAKVLHKIPIYVIVNQDVGLYGAGVVGIKRFII